MPAILKGFLDRVFLPGFAFRHHASDPFSDGLLAGRSGEIWLTSDAPRLWYFLKYWNAPIRAMKTATLEFCGVRPVAVTTVDRDVVHRMSAFPRPERRITYAHHAATPRRTTGRGSTRAFQSPSG